MTTSSSLPKSLPESIPSTASSFFQTINTLSSKFPALLDDFKKSYVQFNMNPSNNENRNIYSKMNSSLEHLNSEVVATTTHLQTRIGDLLSMIHALDQRLAMAKNKNAKLEKKWAHTEGSDNGSQMMIDDSKELYKMQRISNIDMILGNVLLLIVLFRVFRSLPIK
jgi:hypothetical protein